jgi:acyl carrier protein
MEEIFKTIQSLIAEQFAVEPEEVTMETSLEEDLGADSVDLVELVMAMEEEFEIGEVQEDELGGMKTVGDAVGFIAGKLK